MLRENASDLVAFLAVAEEGSFTRAAERLGISQSALSQAMRGLEKRLGVRLLSRTTRRVAPTEAGQRLYQVLLPRFEDIRAELQALNEFRDLPAGRFRITATEYAVQTLLLPKLATFLPLYPDISVEVVIDYGLTDIVAEHFDAGVRAGEQVEKDMIAVRIGPDIDMAVVGSPAYFAAHPAPLKPEDLTEHTCINLRLTTRGTLYAWELVKDGRQLDVNVSGQLVLNNSSQMVMAAALGLGLAFVPRDLAAPYLADGRLQRVLTDWCPIYSGFHLYYPNRHQSSRAFNLLVDALRYRS